MPGTRLSNTEKDLLRLWKKSGNFPYPILSDIHIEGNPGLRGIQKLDIKFDYPLTVICGKNGCNKKNNHLGFSCSGISLTSRTLPN